MTRKILIAGYFPAEAEGPASNAAAAPSGRFGWTRSFPEGSVEGCDWMLDVIADLQDYACHHRMEDAAELMRETRCRLDRILKAG